MAIKYNRHATNKDYGAANAGYVRTGSASDGLAKALASASQSVAIGENLRINNKKDKVNNFSGFRNRTDKLKFKTKIFLDLGKENKSTNISMLTAKIKAYLNSKVKNKNNYTQK